MTTLHTVGKYEILSTLGAGSMGTVYRAFDPALQRMVAIKMINFGWLHEVQPQELAARFRTEARAAAHLNHPAIVTIFDYDDGDPAGAYIAMEYVEGGSLDRYLEQHGQPPLEDIVCLMQQVLAGLDYAHVRGVIHRDIKPHNLLLTRDGLVKITDFGIAKIRAQGNETLAGFSAGTPMYMAPEQYMGGPVDHRCDIHAAGAVLYQLLTGAAPYTGSYAEIMYKICHEEPKPLAGLERRVLRVFDPLVARALHKRPEQRYGSAADFSKALQSAWQEIARKPVPARLSEAVVGSIMSRQSVAVRPRPLPERVADPTVQVTIVEEATSLHAKPPDAGATVTLEEDALPARVGPAVVYPAAVTSTRDTPGAGSLSAWSRDQLVQIERQLAPIVGPVARVLVRRAATRTASRQEIYRLLANHLHTQEERQQFLLAGDRRPAQTTLMLRSGTSGGSRGRAVLPGPVTAEVTRRATRLLARYMGPIAVVLTRRAAQSAGDELELYTRLAQKLTDGEERERFLTEAGCER